MIQAGLVKEVYGVGEMQARFRSMDRIHVGGVQGGCWSKGRT